MPFLKETHDILTDIKNIKTAIQNGTDPSDAIQAALKDTKDLREKVVGIEDTMYAYTCQCTMCKNHCTCELNHMIRDATYCEDAGASGNANWVQTGTRKVTTT
jgi:hypothetical protein